MSEKLKNKTLYYFNKSFIEHAVEIIKLELKVNGINSGFIISQIPGDTEDKKSALEINVFPQVGDKIHEIIQRYHWDLIKGSGYMCHVINTFKAPIPPKPKEGEIEEISFPEFLSGVLGDLTKHIGEVNKMPENPEIPDVMRVRSNIGLLTPSQVSLVGKIKRMGNDFHAFLSNAPLSIPGEYSREIEIAQKKIEEAVMWAVKGVTK
jgi:hypothetical protein